MRRLQSTFYTIIGLVLMAFPAAPSYAQGAPSLTLDAALQHAGQTSPSILAAREELEEVRELYPQARAGWLPSLSAESSIYATDIDTSNFTNGDGATTKDFSVNLEQPVFRGGRTIAETARARYLIQAGEATLVQEEQNLYLKVISAYLKLLRDAEVYTLRINNRQSLQKEMDATQERYNLGDTTITDVHQARQRVERAQAELVGASGRYRASEAVFEEVVGLKPAALVRPSLRYDFPQDSENMIGMAENYNPKIWVARYRQQAAEEDVNATFRQLFPQISAFANYNKQYDPQPGIIDDSAVQTVGLRASLALYEGGAVRSRVRERKHAAKRLEYTIQDTSRQIAQEIRSNWHEYAAAKQALTSRQAEIDAAAMALEGVKEEARLGQRTTLDILDAERELSEAKILLAQARHDEMLAQFALAARVGALAPQLEQNRDLRHGVAQRAAFAQAD